MKIRNPYIIWNVDSMGKFTILVNQQQQKTGIYMYFEIQMRNEFIYQQWLFSAGKFMIMFTWTDL